MDYIKQVFVGIYNTTVGFFTSDFWLAKATLALLTLLGGIKLYVFSILTLALLDVITGVWASSRQGHLLTSKLLWRGLLAKVGLYLILLYAVMGLDIMLQSVLPMEKFYMVFVVSLLISVYEVTSIIENAVNINKDLAFLRAFASMWSRMVNKRIAVLEEKVDAIEEKKPDEKKEI
jgi:phage-related holin